MRRLISLVALTLISSGALAAPPDDPIRGYVRQHLGDVLSDLNRLSDIHVACDEAACNLLYTGSLTLHHRSAEETRAWVHDLTDIFRVEVIETGPWDVLVRYLPGR